MKKRNPIVKIKEGSGDGPLIHLEPGAWAQRPAPIQPGDDNTRTRKKKKFAKSPAKYGGPKKSVSRRPLGPGDSITPRAGIEETVRAFCARA